MAGVGAPLEADYQVVLCREKVDEFALGFVTPLQTNNASAWHASPRFIQKKWWESRQGWPAGKPAILVGRDWDGQPAARAATSSLPMPGGMG